MVVVGDGDVNIYKHETCMFEKPFICFETENFFIGKPRLCKMTEESGAKNDVGFNANNFLVDITNPEQSSEYVYISGYEI